MYASWNTRALALATFLGSLECTVLCWATLRTFMRRITVGERRTLLLSWRLLGVPAKAIALPGFCMCRRPGLRLQLAHVMESYIPTEGESAIHHYARPLGKVTRLSLLLLGLPVLSNPKAQHTAATFQSQVVGQDELPTGVGFSSSVWPCHNVLLACGTAYGLKLCESSQACG